MTSDIDIHRTANVLIKQHGDDAPIHAATRADELLAAISNMFLKLSDLVF